MQVRTAHTIASNIERSHLLLFEYTQPGADMNAQLFRGLTKPVIHTVSYIYRVVDIGCQYSFLLIGKKEHAYICQSLAIVCEI